MRANQDTSGTRPPVKEMLASLTNRLDQSKITRRGDIVLRLSGEGGGNYCLSCGLGQTTLRQTDAMGDRPPLIEMSGDAQIICDIFEGKRNAFKQFLAGGLRLRGDLRYFSDLAFEMKIIDQPL